MIEDKNGFKNEIKSSTTTQITFGKVFKDFEDKTQNPNDKKDGDAFEAKPMKSAFKLNQKYTKNTNEIKKPKESERQTIFTIKNDSESSKELDDNNIQIKTQRTQSKESFNSDVDKDYKKTEKYSDRSSGNDEIVRQIISNSFFLKNQRTTIKSQKIVSIYRIKNYLIKS